MALEQKATTEYRQILKSKVREKLQELEAHNGTKPREVPKPDALTDAEKADLVTVAAKLDTERLALFESNKAVAQALEKRKNPYKKLEQLRKLESRLSNFVSEFERLRAELVADVLPWISHSTT